MDEYHRKLLLRTVPGGSCELAVLPLYIIQEVRHQWTTRVAYNQTTTEVLIHASASSSVQACQGTSDSLQSGIEQCY